MLKRGLHRTSKAMFWRPSVKEIGDWLDEIYLKFVEKENTNPRCSAHDFLQRYVFCDIYEIFFGSIHIELHQWLSRLTERKTKFQEGQFSDCIPIRISILKRVNNKISQAVDFWTTRTLEAFVTAFTINTSTSFSEAE